MSMIHDLNQICRFGEKVVNVAECVPFLGATVGMARAKGGSIQSLFAIGVIAGGAFTYLGVLVFDNNDDNKLKCRKAILFGGEQFIHGCLNSLKGCGVVILSTFTFGIGNVVLVVPHLLNKDRFGSLLPYGVLSESLNK